MIRHPFLRALQLLIAVALSLLGALVHARPRSASPDLCFGLSVVGESESSDGSWSGVDLLADRSGSAERFQINVRPTQPARMWIDEIAPDGAHRLYPRAGEQGILHPGKEYALPAPHLFYERDARVHLRVTLVPLDSVASSAPLAVAAGHGEGPVTRLSDGTGLMVSEALYRGSGGGSVELEF
jgi:hypothetical protein